MQPTDIAYVAGSASCKAGATSDAVILHTGLLLQFTRFKRISSFKWQLAGMGCASAIGTVLLVKRLLVNHLVLVQVPAVIPVNG